MPTDEYLHQARARGFLHQCTDEEGLAAALRAGVVSGYVGFDCTADSLHVGNLVGIMNLRLLQRCGHRPVPLMGGGTTKIGDPSGKDESRQMLTVEKIGENMAGIRRCFDPFLTFGDAPTDAIMPNNADWLDQLGYIALLREVGPHFTINRMLTFDSVRLRLEREQALTFLEFNYMILQSYDYRELFRRHGVRLQMGGSDQWGNIVSGVDLVRRMESATVFGLTTPLITTASGAKMGKSVRGAVWLRADRLAPFDYWQFWRNTEDGDVGRFLKLFTDMPLPEIARLEALGGAEINDAKAILATETTALLHGRAAAQAARDAAKAVFEGVGEASLPEVSIAAEDAGDGVPVYRLFVLAKLAASNAEARRLIRGGGARLDDDAIADETMMVAPARLAQGVKLSAGRKQHRLAKLAG